MGYTAAMKELSFILNGHEVKERNVAPTTTLLQYLRQHLQLTGTKEGCAEGDCGACTVAVLDPHGEDGPTYRAINACLVLLPMMQGQTIVTVEGLKTGDQLHPVQQKLIEAFGSQCGYCTPGVVMSLFEACYRKDLDAEWKVDDQLCGNLCRCTGYRPIRESARSLAGRCPNDRFLEDLRQAESSERSVHYESEGELYLAPESFDALFDHLDTHPDVRFVAGGTDLSLEITKRFVRPKKLLSLEAMEALSEHRVEGDTWVVGAGVTLSRLERSAPKYAPALARMLRFFAARQIKNRATIGGNLCTASPIGDLAPVLLMLDAEFVLRSRAGERIVPSAEFFLGYRKTALRKKEIMSAVRIPILTAHAEHRLSAYKVSKRQELDISAVSAGLRVELEHGKVKRARFAFGGLAATPARASRLEAAVTGQPWTEASLEKALPALEQDYKPIDDHRGSAWYRMTIAKRLVLGFLLETETEPSPEHAYRPTGTVDPEVSR